jgi:hypothetical protein
LLLPVQLILRMSMQNLLPVVRQNAPYPSPTASNVQPSAWPVTPGVQAQQTGGGKGYR